MAQSKIRIGLYGAGGAGKTSFFRHLVSGASLPVPPRSALSRFMSASLDSSGRIVPTTALGERLDIRAERTTWTVYDHPGTALSEAIDHLELDSGSTLSQNILARQIRSSDLILFFFDLSCGGDPNRLGLHGNKELLRAKQLIDFVLKTRQNRFVPILFVFTHQDRIVTEPALCQLSDQWVTELTRYIEAAYEEQFGLHYPKALTRRQHLFHFLTLQPSAPVAPLFSVLQTGQFLLRICRQFRRQDRRSSRRLVYAALITVLLFLFLPLFCVTSPSAGKWVSFVRDRATPYMEKIPAFKKALVNHEQELTDSSLSLDPLWNDQKPLDQETARSLNRSLFMLMKRLNRLEDNDQKEEESYRHQRELWDRAMKTVETRFDTDSEESGAQKLEIYGLLLSMLSDSPSRAPTALENAQRKYWEFYRTHLISEFQARLQIHIETGTPSERILHDLARELERYFREVAQSKVRGNNVDASILSSSPEKINRKESLKQDLGKTCLACQNYAERYSVSVTIVTATHQAEIELDREHHYRLLFYGGREGMGIPNELTVSSGFGESVVTFIPARKDFSVLMGLESPIQVILEKKSKESTGQWETISTWNVETAPRGALSLDPLGIRFYLRFENDENTTYRLTDQGFQFDLTLRRPTNVPEFLWEIMALTNPATPTQQPQE